MAKLRVAKYKKDINKVKLSGEIFNLPDFTRIIQVERGVRPLISFDVKSYRPLKNNEEEAKFDINKIVIFDDEQFLQTYKEGDRLLFEGELQSRNYNRVHEEMDEVIAIAVQNYYLIHEKYPCAIQPLNKKKQPIIWEELLKFGLIEEIPSDSMYQENMVKTKTPDTPFIYLVDEEGESSKESQHVTYEVVVTAYHKLEEPLDVKKGDINRVKMAGVLTEDVRANVLGEQSVFFVNFKIGTKSSFFKNHFFHNTAIAWGEKAKAIFEEVKLGDYVMVKGRLQSRDYVKTVVKRWKTPAGHRKKKEILLPLITREISIMYIEKQKPFEQTKAVKKTN